MFLERDIADRVRSGARKMPIVAIIGPRQSGKSMLVKELFKNHRYIDMQDPELSDYANKDPKGFLSTFNTEHGLILDEIHYAPKLLSQLKMEVEKNSRPGYYILLAPHDFFLDEILSESLAGIMYLYILLPLSISELKKSRLLLECAEEQLLHGFYPRVYESAIDTREYYEQYISVRIERDIRMVKNFEKSVAFRRFIQLCALRIGSPINFSELARDARISINTAKSWLSLLQTSFTVFFLPSYYKNLSRRIIKSPKLYFYDVGLALMFLNANKETFTKKRDLYGSLFENMLIADALKNCHNRGLDSRLSFFRDTNQNEIDLIIESASVTVPVDITEIKSVDSVSGTLTWFIKQTGGDQKPLVFYGGDQELELSGSKAMPWNYIDSTLFV